MADWLLVRLARDGEQPLGWVSVATDGHLTGAPATGDAAALSAEAVGHRIALLVPGIDVLQLAVVLPTGNEARQAQIVPYALEEQVAEDVESLHFAVGQPTGGQGSPTPVNVVSRTVLDAWLAQAGGLGISPQALYADSELVPLLTGHVTLLLDGDTLVLRTESTRPAVLPADDPAFALGLAIGSDPEVWAASHLTVYATSLDWQKQSDAIEALRPRLASLKVQLLSGGVLALLATQLHTAAPINLLQGGYAPVRSGAVSWRAWRLAAALAAVLLVTHLVGESLQLRRLAATEKTLDAGLAQAFSQAMPGEPPGSKARARVEQRLVQLRSAAPEGGSLLTLMTAVAGAHAASPTAHIDALSFRKGLLDLKVTGPDAESLERINQSLRSTGLHSELASGSARGQNYEGRLQVRSTAP